ncbi:MAG TPA: PH domain-containing protein [Micromonosporaceae bacterium]|nr:PH domain-containing protein [Micromonosporaceae bacterium]
MPDEPGARRFHDRDTEPIPRARAEPARSAERTDEVADPPPTDDASHSGSSYGAPSYDDAPTAYSARGSYEASPYDGSAYDSGPGAYPQADPGAERYVGSASPGAYYPDGDVRPRFTEDEFAGLHGGESGQAVYTSRRVLPLENEPSGMVSRYLFPTEKFRGEWKRHWIQLAKEFAIGAVATIVMGYAAGLAGSHDQGEVMALVIIIWAIIMAYVIWQIADWYYDRFILTNKRVMVVKGLITRNVAMMPLLRVTDMKYVQSPLGRLLNYGNFELESAGQDQALSKIRNLPNPNELYLRIVEEMYEPEAVEARLGRSSEPESADGT